MMNEKLYEAILRYDTNKAVDIVKEELDKGVDPLVLINESLIPAMDEVGKRFSEGSLYIPEMILAAQAFQTSLDEIKPKLLVERESQGAVVIGTNSVGAISRGPWKGRVYGGQSIAADKNGRTIGKGKDRDRDIAVVRVELGGE